MNIITEIESNKNLDESDIDSEARAELDRYIDYVMSADLEIIYEILDKVGEVIRRGTCTEKVLGKIRNLADSVGGSFVIVDVIC